MAPNLGNAAGRPTARAAGAEVGALFSEHGRMIYGLCRLLLRDAEEAEDAMQQVFLSAHRGLMRGQAPRDAAAWLAAIARNECIRRGRAAGVPALPLAEEIVPGADPTHGMDQREEVEALCRAISELPPQQRHAIVLREFYGLSYREVAAALGVSDAAVQSLLFRSRKTLETRLRGVRSAFNALTVPLALQTSLAELVPGFSAGTAAVGGTSGVLAKVIALPGAAKATAVVLAVGGAGTVAAVKTTPEAPQPAARQAVALPAPRPAQRESVAVPRARARPPAVQTAVLPVRRPAAVPLHRLIRSTPRSAGDEDDEDDRDDEEDEEDEDDGEDLDERQEEQEDEREERVDEAEPQHEDERDDGGEHEDESESED